MKIFRRTVALLMSFTICLSVCGCKFTSSDKDKGDKNSTISSGGGYSSNSNGDYDSTVSDWQQSGENTGENEFNKTDSDTPATTPGSSIQQTVVNVNRPLTSDTETTAKPVRGSVLASGLDFSELTDESDLQYIYKGKNYAYGITKDNKEYIAFKDEYGDMVDVFNGAGKVSIKNETGTVVLASGNMTDWKEGMLDSWPSITTHYVLSTSGGSNEFLEIAYVFKENNISVSAKVRVNSTTALSNGELKRAFMNNPKSSSARINCTWNYPSDGDEPYEEFESLTFRNQISDSIYAYTYLRTVDQLTCRYVDVLNGDSLPIDIVKSEDDDPIYGVSVDVKYDISFVDTSTDNNQGADYLGLFRSWDSQFAAGIALTEATDDRSTVVEGNSVKLNLNVTNLTEEDLKFSLRYDIRNHYGDIVDAGLFVDNTVYKYADANRAVSVSGKYGMYYLNLYVISEHSTYRECFPFALIPEYEYTYWDTNPFAINSPNCNRNNKDEWVTTGRLLVKTGTASQRVNASEYVLWMTEEMERLGSHRWVGGINVTEATENTLTTWKNNVEKSIDSMVEAYGNNLVGIEFGNEFNLKCLAAGGPSEEEVYPIWYKYVFEPSYDLLKSKYPNVTYIPTPDSACSPNWLNQFVNGYVNSEGKQEGKVWNLVTMVDTHIYGPPQMPDSYGSYNPKQDNPGASLWQIEDGMQRMDANLKRLNPDDPTKTDFMLTEVGYTSTPTDNNVDYRTQADYIVRIGAICLGYGADIVQYYCMYDRTSLSSGTNDNGEWNFGLFHEHDYYGIVKPKPSGIAFSIMTRVLESYKKNSGYIDYKYDEGWWNGGVRTFALDTDLNGTVLVAWSNQEVLPNGKKKSNGTFDDRLPTLPWESQWKETDPTVFETEKGATVKVIDSMGNATNYVDEDKDGEVTIPLSGSPVYIIGAKK